MKQTITCKKRFHTQFSICSQRKLKDKQTQLIHKALRKLNSTKRQGEKRKTSNLVLAFAFKAGVHVPLCNPAI